jgi:putative zinc finger protein
MSGHPGELLSAFLDGELSAADQAAVEGHLRECAACAQELEELAAVDACARELPVPAPAGYFEELPGRVRARVRRPVRVPRLAVWAAAAAAAAVMAVTVTPLLMQRERSVTAPAAQSAPHVPATGAAPPSTVPPAEAGFADAGATHDRVLPAPQAKREEQGRLRERDRADKPTFQAPAAPVAPPALPRPAEEALRKTNAGIGGLAPRREAEPATVPPAAAAAAPAEDRVAEVAGALSETARAEPTADAQKERAAPPPERKLAAGGGAFAHPDDRALMMDKRYRALLARSATSAAQARALRDAWELFARDVPTDAHADEARVRAIEAGVLAWRLGHDRADLATAQARGRAYLEAESAPQGARVRAILDALP